METPPALCECKEFSLDAKQQIFANKVSRGFHHTTDVKKIGQAGVHSAKEKCSTAERFIFPKNKKVSVTLDILHTAPDFEINERQDLLWSALKCLRRTRQARCSTEDRSRARFLQTHTSFSPRCLTETSTTARWTLLRVKQVRSSTISSAEHLFLEPRSFVCTLSRLDSVQHL